jgi:hypothetical protein
LHMRNLLICILTLGCGLLGRPVSAQADQRAARVPVLLAVVDSLPDTGLRFRIVQMVGESVRDVVLLPPDANPDLLAEALETLRMVWTRGGDPGTAGGGVMFRRAESRTEPRPRRVPPWSDRVLHDLREARPRQIPGVGHVRAVQIWLAPRPAGAARGQY